MRHRTANPHAHQRQQQLVIADDVTVFVVDDDRSFRRAVARLLRTEGFAVETYASGRAFLEALRAPRRGCVVLDVRMPGLSGVDVLRSLVAAGATLGIVLVTGDAEAASMAQNAEVGFCRLLMKPLEHEMLLDAVRVALREDEAPRR